MSKKQAHTEAKKTQTTKQVVTEAKKSAKKICKKCGKVKCKCK